jgi:hypothetical protein
MKKSGPVPKENVAAVTVVAAVIPAKSSTKEAGPTVEGLKFKSEALAFGKVPPLGTKGRII